MNFFNETIKRFFSKSNSEDDLKKLFLWFNSAKGQSEIKKSLDKSWDTFEEDDNIEVDSGKMIQNIKNRIQYNQTSKLRLKMKQFLPYAAMLAIVFCFVFYLSAYFKNNTDQFVNTNNISVITEKGQRSKVILPDSSIVWLNSGTTLSYCENFSQNERKVTLDGQAFFDVAHKTDSPFTVQCNDLLISVLGTKFDVGAYPESSKISVMLESGKVELSHQRIKSFTYTMSPGELAEFDVSDYKMNIRHPDMIKYCSWKDGVLLFKNDPMEMVIEKLERWYNIDVVVKDAEVYQSIFTGTIQNESYEQIFRLIEFSCPVKCQIIYAPEPGITPKIIITKSK
jgi:ferric-dicitrate binding protein FerR (iron transport regulator)